MPTRKNGILEGKRAILFDAGFTILEPCRPVAEVYYDAACALGVELPQTEFNDCLKAAWPKATREFRSGHSDLASSDALEREAWKRFTHEVARPFPKLAEQKDAWLAALFDHFDAPGAWKPIPLVNETLEELKRQGFIMGVVSNWHSVLHSILAGHALTEHFAFVITSAEAGRKKPHREIFEKGLAAARSEASETLHVGDSWEEDIEGARLIGITPVYLRRNSTSEQIVDEEISEIKCLSELLA